MKTHGLAVATAVMLSGCMTIPGLLPGAADVRYITAEEAKQCSLIKPVVYDTSYITTYGKSPERFERTGDIGIRNAALAAGGNAVFLTSKESNWFVGTFNYQGGAYRC